MREAVKAKDKELKRVANFTFKEWCTLQGVENTFQSILSEGNDGNRYHCSNEYQGA